MKNKNMKKIVIVFSVLLFIFSASLFIKKIGAVTGLYWCQYNLSCIRGSSCTCPSGTVSSTDCPTGYTAPAGSNSSADCVQGCSASTVSGYSVPALNSGSSVAVSKSPCYRASGGLHTAWAVCNDGTISIINESNLFCFSGYHYTYGGWYLDTYGCYYACVLEVCSAGSVGGYDYPQLNHAATTTDTRPITGGTCTGTLRCGDGSVVLQSESCSCNAGYYMSGTSCLACPSGTTSSAGASVCYCAASSGKGYVYPQTNYKSTNYMSKTSSPGSCWAYRNCDPVDSPFWPLVSDGCTCPAGYGVVSDKVAPPTINCFQCPAGTYSAGTNHLAIGGCNECPAGTYSSAGASSCYALCGNGVCDSSLGETCSSCPNDCGGCSCWGDYECNAGQSCEGPGYCSGYDTYACYYQPTDESTCVNSCYGYWYLSSSGVCCGDGCWDTYGGQCYCY